MSDPIEKTATAAKPKKRFRILLGASLALNLLVIGAVVGAMTKGPSGPAGLREAALPYVGAFDHEDKRAMRRDMKARLTDRRESRAAHEASYRAFLTLLRAETFDAVAAADIIDTQFERTRRFQKVGREVSIQRISNMSPEKRAAYADRLEHRLDNPRTRGKRKER